MAIETRMLFPNPFSIRHRFANRMRCLDFPRLIKTICDQHPKNGEEKNCAAVENVSGRCFCQNFRHDQFPRRRRIKCDTGTAAQIGAPEL
jgi:hypothetical protein